MYITVFYECMEVATGKEIVMDNVKEKLMKEMSDTFYHTLFPLNAKLCVQDKVECLKYVVKYATYF